MKMIARAWLVAGALCLTTGCSNPASLEADFLISNVNVVPMASEVVLADQAVAVRDGEIVAVVDATEIGAIDAGQVVDGEDLYLMPGLSDMHVHLRMDPQAFLNLHLANGVTTVHNMGNADGGGALDHVALRAAVAEGDMAGPRYLISGPQLHDTELPDISAVAAVLEDHAAHGYDTIKVHGDLPDDAFEALMAGAEASGFRVTGHFQHMMPLERSLRMDAVEHIEEFLYTDLDGQLAARSGGDDGDLLAAYYANVKRLHDPAYRRQVVEAVVRSGIFVDATLIIYATIGDYLDDDRFAALPQRPELVYLPASTRADYLDAEANEYRANLIPLFSGILEREGDPLSPAGHVDSNVALMSTLMLELHEAGVPLLLGSDVFGAVVPGFATHQELALMVDAGLTPYEALRTGTVNPAAYLGESDRAGTLEPGKRADFILVKGNPLENIGQAAAVEGVYTGKHWYAKEDLAGMLVEAERLAVAD